MLTTLTSWLRPSPARRRKAALRAVEHLEDHTVPDNAPHNLFTGAFGPQDWANAGLISTNDNWAGVGSIVGSTGGSALGLSAGADPRGITTPSTGGQQVTANEVCNPEDVTYSGIAEFQSLQVVAFRADATNQAPNLVIYLNTNGVNGTTISFDVKSIRSSPSTAGNAFLLTSNTVAYRPLDGSPAFPFGNVSGGTGTSALVVQFISTQVTPKVVAALMRAIEFNVNSFDTTTRIVRFNLTDGDGPDSATASNSPARVLYADSDTFLVVNPTPVNNAPSFAVPAAGPTVLEDAAALSVPAFATSISPGPASYEAGQSVTFQVTNNTNAGLFNAAPAISPTGTLTFTPAPNTNGTATITVRLMDDGGTANGGIDTSAAQTFTITVNPVNDDPVLGGVTSPVPYLVGQAGTPVLPTVTLTDDSADFDTGTLTVSYTAGAVGNETLNVRANGPLGRVGTVIQYNGVSVGTLTSGNAAGQDLVVLFDSDATPTIVQEVLRNVVFSAPAVAGDRDLSVTLTDGDGGMVTAPVTVRVADQVTAVSLDKTDPAAAVAGPSFTWRLTTDLPVSGFNPTNFQLVGTVAGFVTDPLAITQLGSTTVEITATLTSPVQGTLGLNLVDENGLTVGVLNVPPPFPGGLYDVDRVGPTVTAIDDNDADNVLAVNQTQTYTVKFGEDVQDGTFTVADLVNVGSATVTFGTITETSPGVFSVPVTPTGGGTIRFQVPAGGVKDVLGNDGQTAFLDGVVAVDAVAPTVVAPVVNDANTPLPNVPRRGSRSRSPSRSARTSTPPRWPGSSATSVPRPRPSAHRSSRPSCRGW